MSFRTGRRKDDSTYKYPIENGNEYVPKDLEVERIPSHSNTYEELVKEELERIDSVEDFEERIEAKSNLVHRISEAQDIANLDIRGEFYKNDPSASEDSRWEAINMLDSVNAIFLGVSSARYDPKYFIEWGYVPEKMGSLISRWYSINRKNEEGLLRKRTEEEREKSRIEFKERGGQY